MNGKIQGLKEVWKCDALRQAGTNERLTEAQASRRFQDRIEDSGSCGTCSANARVDAMSNPRMNHIFPVQ